MRKESPSQEMTGYGSDGIPTVKLYPMQLVLSGSMIISTRS